MMYKWLFCGPCNRIFRNESSELTKHAGHRPIRIAGNEPWYHMLYEPGLFLDWLKVKWQKQ